MRFDNIAMAANTPGGFQAGVNDIVQAIMGAKRQQAQQAFQEAQATREQGNLDRSFGAQQAQQLAGNKFREREVASTEARTKNDAIQNGQRFTMGMMDRAGSVGQDLADRMFGKPGAARAGSAKDPNALTEAQRLAHEAAKTKSDEDWARMRTSMNSDGTRNVTGKKLRTVPGDYGMGVTVVTDGQGNPVWDDTLEKRPMTDADWREYYGHLDARRNPQSKADANSQFRRENLPPVPRQASGAAGLGSQVAESLAPNTGSTNGLSQNEGPGTQAHTIAENLMPRMLRNPIDYEAEDLKLQALDPKYKQRRAVPGFNWKGVIDETVRRRAQPTR